MLFNSLDDVEKYIETIPGWTTHRGRETFMQKFVLDPTDDYEVLQIFRPGETLIPVVECWRGYYRGSFNEYTGFCKAGNKNFGCIGSMEFAMTEVVAEKEKGIIA